jgi:hypothetical protein
VTGDDAQREAERDEQAPPLERGRWTSWAWRPPRRSRRTRRRAITFGILAGLGALLILLTLDGLWSARAMLRGVTAARSDLGAGVEEVVTGDPDVAYGTFQDASAAANSAIGASGHPSMRLAGLLPYVGDNLDGVVAVARAERDSAGAGLVLVEAARALGWRDILLPATSSLGEVDLTKVREAAPLLDDVAARLRTTLDILEAEGGGGLLGPVATGYDDALSSLELRAALAGDAARLARLLPGFLGGDGVRSYLVAVQRLGETAPAGGAVGAVGVLSATDGVMTLAPLAVAEAPTTLATTSPRGPDAAAALLSAAAEAGLGSFDGVVLTDSVGLQELLWMTGDAEVAGRKDPLRFEDGITSLEREPFLGPDRTTGETRQAELWTAVLESALGRRPSAEAFAAAAAGIVAGRHLVLFSTTKREQALIRGLGAAGVADAGRNPLAWTATSTAPNLAGTYARWVTTQVVTLEADGSARIKTTVEFQNRAPDGPPSALLGRAFGAERVGAWAADLRLILPKGADGVTGETSTPSETVVGEAEDGSPFLDASLHADPGSAMTLIVGYRRPAAALVLDGNGAYRMRVVPQPLAYPGVVRIRIVMPDGTSVTDASAAFERGVDVVRFEGTPAAPLDLFVRYG